MTCIKIQKYKRELWILLGTVPIAAMAIIKKKNLDIETTSEEGETRSKPCLGKHNAYPEHKSNECGNKKRCSVVPQPCKVHGNLHTKVFRDGIYQDRKRNIRQKKKEEKKNGRNWTERRGREQERHLEGGRRGRGLY